MICAGEGELSRAFEQRSHSGRAVGFGDLMFPICAPKVTYKFGVIIAAACAVGSSAALAQVPFRTTLELDVENIVSYSSDLLDASKFATDPNLTTAAGVRNFQFVMAIGDIVAVNGEPAKG